MAKVNEHTSGAEFVIIQVYIKQIAITHSQVVTKLIEQVTDDKSDVNEDTTHNDSQGELSLANTAVFNGKVTLMQTATVVVTNGEDY